MRLSRILHATDFSPASRPAFRMAQALARALRTELILCHAYQRIIPAGGGAPPGAIPPRILEEMWADQRAEATRRLATLAKAARRGRVRVSTLLVEGAPTVAIVRAARRKHASLVVLGTRGRTGVARMLLGSVAERVVRTAPCPVLTVGGGAR